MNFFGKFPLVRLKQFRDNPAFIWYYLKRLFIYKYTSHYFVPKYKEYTFLSAEETFEYLLSHRVSLARFSDGDIEQLTGAGIYPPDSDWSQKSSKELRTRLKEALASTDSRLLIAHESPSVFLKNKREAAASGVVYNMWTDTRRLLWRYLSKGVVYGHAHVFVPNHNPNLNWNRLKEFLATKDVVIVTGGTQALEYVRLGRRTFFIETGKHNAFEKYDEIIMNIKDMFVTKGLKKEETLIMASLGPTADILAYDLSREGFQVWDTGHFFKFAEKQITTLSEK